MTECDEVISIMDNVSTKKSNNIARNVTSTASIKERDIYILNTVLIWIILVLIIIIICYFIYKTKRYNIKWKIMNFKKFVLKIVHFIISMT